MGEPTQNPAPTLLLMDDNELVRESFQGFLEDRGFAVLEAENGRVGLDIFEKGGVDLALVDLEMPELDGLDVLEYLAKTSPETPTIVVSGTGNIRDAVQALHLGAWDYVLKPVESLSVLLHAVERALERARLLRENREHQEHLQALVEQRTAELRATNESLTREMAVRTEAEARVRSLNRDLERRVRERTAQLEAANKELEAFAYSVSHDLRAPLRAIDGFCRILVETHHDNLDTSGRKYLGQIHTSACEMGHLIDDLLRLSRVTRGELRREETNLSKLAKDVAAKLDAAAPEQHVDFHVGEDMTAVCDAKLLQAVLENLLGNAWKFTSKVDKPKVAFTSELRDGERVFCVRDNGAGFNMDYAGKLFGAFQRLHRSEEYEGTGIGLATVRRIIRRHGGEVWADSKVDEGASFFFNLPELSESETGEG